jgi:hypothetical protein
LGGVERRLGFDAQARQDCFKRRRFVDPAAFRKLRAIDRNGEGLTPALVHACQRDPCR